MKTKSMETLSEITEICNEMYRVHFTVTQSRVTIQRVTVGGTIGMDGRDVMRIMDREILRGIHDDLVHRHLNQSA